MNICKHVFVLSSLELKNPTAWNKPWWHRPTCAHTEIHRITLLSNDRHIFPIFNPSSVGWRISLIFAKILSPFCVGFVLSVIHIFFSRIWKKSQPPLTWGVMERGKNLQWDEIQVIFKSAKRCEWWKITSVHFFFNVEIRIWLAFVTYKSGWYFFFLITPQAD